MAVLAAGAAMLKVSAGQPGRGLLAGAVDVAEVDAARSWGAPAAVAVVIVLTAAATRLEQSVEFGLGT